MTHLVDKNPAKKIDAARLTWTKSVDGQRRGGSLVDRQASIKAVRRLKEGGGVRRRNNGKGEKEKWEETWRAVVRSLFSPLGNWCATSKGVECEKERERIKSDILENRRKWARWTDGRKQSETRRRRRRRSGGGRGSSIAASITSGERADSSEAICLSFRANLLRPGSSLSPFPFVLFLLRSKTPSPPPSSPVPHCASSFL